MKTQSEKLKDTVEQAGFYRTGHPVKTYLKYLSQSNSVKELTNKISQRSLGYIPLFANKLAVALFNQKENILS